MEDNKKLENEELEEVNGGVIVIRPNSKSAEKPSIDLVTDESKLAEDGTNYKCKPMQKHKLTF